MCFAHAYTEHLGGQSSTRKQGAQRFDLVVFFFFRNHLFFPPWLFSCRYQRFYVYLFFSLKTGANCFESSVYLHKCILSLQRKEKEMSRATNSC